MCLKNDRTVQFVCVAWENWIVPFRPCTDEDISLNTHGEMRLTKQYIRTSKTTLIDKGVGESGEGLRLHTSINTGTF